MNWKIYLSGEIHSNWRDQIVEKTQRKNLLVEFSGPVTDHDASDNVGVSILGPEDKSYWKDQKAAKINAIRIQKAINTCDLLIIKFGEKYRQWNAAYDAGYAKALGKPYVVIHPEEFSHALKEVDAGAMAVAENEDQIVDILEYIINKK